jgi:hypothetical protein
MPRSLKALATLPLVLLLAATPARSVTIAPGTTSPPLAAIDCAYASGSLDNISDLTCPPTVCLQACDAPNNRAKISFNISDITVGRRYVETTVYTDFTVDAGTEGAGRELDGTINYDVSWAGGWTLAGLFTGFNDVQSNMTLILWDLTAGGAVVKQAAVHHMDASSAGTLPEVPVDVGVGFDHGETANSITAKVIRGHAYRIGLKVRAEGKGALNATIGVDYMSGGWGAWWTDLDVSIAPDLEEQILELTKRVDLLEEQLHHHTHTYLTGKGEGHNNTVASTSEAIIVDDGTPSDDESKVLPPDGGKKPLPAPSVLVTTAPNPFNPTATITYALPDRLPVTIRVYDAQGKLVSTLVDAEEVAGEHKAVFNAAGLASGVYYYRINAGPFTETRKVTLLK